MLSVLKNTEKNTIDERIGRIHSLINELFIIPNRYKNVLYVHSPFCKNRCAYCAYSSVVPVNEFEIMYFFRDVLFPQLKKYERALKATFFDQVFFGGGTPTLATAEQLETVFERIPALTQAAHRFIEASPDTLNQNHISLFGKWRFDLVSIGVQSLWPRVLKKNRRAVTDSVHLSGLCQELAEKGIPASIDLLALIDQGDDSDLKQVGKDLRELAQKVAPAEIVLHCNYHIKCPPDLLLKIIRLLRRFIKDYPEYHCINALLEDSEAQTYAGLHPAFRLRRSSLDVCHYMQALVPRPGTWGHNMLALGHYRDIRLITDYWDTSFYLSRRRANIRSKKTDPEYFRLKKRDARRDEKIRRQIGLKVIPTNPPHFYCEADQKKAEKLLAALSPYLCQ